MIILMSSYSKSSVFNFVLSTLKLKVGVFKFFRFEGRFRKAPFSWRIGEDDRPFDRRNKGAFANSPPQANLAFCGGHQP